MAKILQFPINLDFKNHLTTPFWLRELPEANCGLSYIDKGLLTLFIKHDPYDQEELPFDMQYVLKQFELPDTPFIKQHIDSSYNRLIRLGYVDEETVSWTGLLPWIPKSKIKELKKRLKADPFYVGMSQNQIKRGIQGEMFPYSSKLKPPPRLPSRSSPETTSSNLQAQKKTTGGCRKTEGCTTNNQAQGNSKKTHS